MDETVIERDPSLPPDYVSLAQLKVIWLQKKKLKEEEEERMKKKLQEEEEEKKKKQMKEEEEKVKNQNQKAAVRTNFVPRGGGIRRGMGGAAAEKDKGKQIGNRYHQGFGNRGNGVKNDNPKGEIKQTGEGLGRYGGKRVSIVSTNEGKMGIEGENKSGKDGGGGSGEGVFKNECFSVSVVKGSSSSSLLPRIVNRRSRGGFIRRNGYNRGYNNGKGKMGIVREKKSGDSGDGVFKDECFSVPAVEAELSLPRIVNRRNRGRVIRRNGDYRSYNGKGKIGIEGGNKSGNEGGDSGKGVSKDECFSVSAVEASALPRIANRRNRGGFIRRSGYNRGYNKAKMGIEGDQSGKEGDSAEGVEGECFSVSVVETSSFPRIVNRKGGFRRNGNNRGNNKGKREYAKQQLHTQRSDFSVKKSNEVEFKKSETKADNGDNLEVGSGVDGTKGGEGSEVREKKVEGEQGLSGEKVEKCDVGNGFKRNKWGNNIGRRFKGLSVNGGNNGDTVRSRFETDGKRYGRFDSRKKMEGRVGSGTVWVKKENQ